MIPKEIGYVVKFRKDFVGLVQKAFWEIPEIMGSSCLALIGIAMAGVGAYNYAKNNGDNREYKMVYYIVREDDPRAKLIRNPAHTCYNQEEEDERNAKTKEKPKKRVRQEEKH